MYTEIKEATNFIAKQLFESVPRRQLGFFTEKLANHLALRYSEMWDIDQPIQDEGIRSVTMRVGTTLDVLVNEAARSVGITPDEFVAIPDGMTLFVNPGHVYYNNAKRDRPILIWNGDVKSDDCYTSMPACDVQPDETTWGERGTPSPYFHAMERNNQPKKAVCLRLEPIDPSDINASLPGLHASLKKFVYTQREQSYYMAEEFALTRFGSNRARPDHDVMRRVHELSVINDIGDQGFIRSLAASAARQNASSLRRRRVHYSSDEDSFNSMSSYDRQNMVDVLSELNSYSNGMSSRGSSPSSLYMAWESGVSPMVDRDRRAPLSAAQWVIGSDDST